MARFRAACGGVVGSRFAGRGGGARRGGGAPNWGRGVGGALSSKLRGVMRDNQAVEPDLSEFVFVERFVADAAHREPSARERAGLARQAQKADRRARRRQRRAERVGRLRRGSVTTLAIGLFALGLAWAVGGLSGGAATDPRPSQIRTIYAVPADETVDPSVVPAIR